MEVHLRADERTLVVRVRNLLLLAVERLPLDVLPRHILRTDNPALAAGAAVVEQGAPLIITETSSFPSTPPSTTVQVSVSPSPAKC